MNNLFFILYIYYFITIFKSAVNLLLSFIFIIFSPNLLRGWKSNNWFFWQGKSTFSNSARISLKPTEPNGSPLSSFFKVKLREKLLILWYIFWASSSNIKSAWAFLTFSCSNQERFFSLANKTCFCGKR